MKARLLRLGFLFRTHLFRLHAETKGKRRSNYRYRRINLSSGWLIYGGDSFQKVNARQMSVKPAGKRIPGYKFIKTIGVGGFSKVKLAQKVDTGELFAIKVISLDAIADEKQEESIEKEIRVMSKLRHPNIIRLYGVQRTDTHLFLILEYAPNGELFSKLCNKGPLPESDARKYFQSLIDALDYIHSKHAVHRDLKPENLLLGENNELKVADFGLSSMSLNSRARYHTKCGTPNYISPEILTSCDYLGPPVDVYSAGLVLYVMLTAQTPFGADSSEEILHNVVESNLEFNGIISRDAEELIRMMTEKDPRKRATIPMIKDSRWFQVGYTPAVPYPDEDERKENGSSKDTMDAFELIGRTACIDISPLLTDSQPDIPWISFSVSKPLETIMASFDTALSRMSARTTKIDGTSIKSMVILGDSPVSIQIDVKKIIAETNAVVVSRIKGCEKEFALLCSRLKRSVGK